MIRFVSSKTHRLIFMITLLMFASTAVASFADNLSASLEQYKVPFVSGAPEYNYDVDLKGWIGLSSKLKECRPSHHDLPNPIQITFLKMSINLGGGKKSNGLMYTQQEIDELIQNTYQDYVIQGWKKGKCEVTIAAKPFPKQYITGYPLKEQFVKELFPITKVKCAFDKKELEILVKSAEQAQVEKRDTTVDEKAGEILSRTCHAD